MAVDISCRACGNSNLVRSIWLDSWFDDFKETISDMYTYCTQLEVSSSDLLPQQVCQNCFKNMLVAYEFRKLCRRSHAVLQDQLRKNQSLNPPPLTLIFPSIDADSVCQQNSLSVVEPASDGNSQNDPLPLSSVEPEPEVIPDSETEIEEQLQTKPNLFYRCCFKRCYAQTTDYAELRNHSAKYHQMRRRINGQRRKKEERYVCAVCFKGFSNQEERKMHQLRYQSARKLIECGRCGVRFESEQSLSDHEITANCQINQARQSFRANLIQKVMNAVTTNDTVRITTEEHRVLKDKKFQEQLYRNELASCTKQMQFYYVCKTCLFRGTHTKEIMNHFKSGTCERKYHTMFGFCDMVIRRIVRLECETCNYKTCNSSNMRRHQTITKHSGLRRTFVDNKIADKSYPCEICGIILSSSQNRRRHRSKCLQESGHVVIKSEEESMEAANVETDDTTFNKHDEEEEPLITDIVKEENDLLGSLDPAHHELEIPTESSVPSTTTAPSNPIKQCNRPQVLCVCADCGYTSKYFFNYNRHIVSCRKKWNRRIEAVSSDAPSILSLNGSKKRALGKKEKKPATLLTCSNCAYFTNLRGNFMRHIKMCQSKVYPKVNKPEEDELYALKSSDAPQNDVGNPQ